MISSKSVNEPRGSLTSAEGEKVRLVRISLQQRRHAAGHALIAFVDEFLAEIVVDLLGCDAVMSWQGAVDELRQLKKEKKYFNCNSFKIQKLRLSGEAVGKKNPTMFQWVVYLFIFLIHVNQKARERQCRTVECVFRQLQQVFVGG